MKPDAPTGLDWTLNSVGISFGVALLATFASVSLRRLGEWPLPNFSEYVFAGLFGAATMHFLKPQRPIVVFVVFVPVVAIASLVVTLLFYAYILRAPIEF